MASVKKTQDGTYEVRFNFDGVRRSFYPGTSANKRDAQDVGRKLDRLAYYASQGETPPPLIGEWLSSLTDRQHNKLAGWGLVERRKLKKVAPDIVLGDWLADYIKRGKRDEATNKQLVIVADNLKHHLGADRPIKSITPGDAEDFRVWLETKARKVPKDAPPRGLAKNTVRRRVGRAREFFNLAVRRKIIAANPFAAEKVTVGGNPERQFFVPSDWIDRCIKVANCEDWRIMLAFARYAGMRSHETRLQRWEDIDIPNRRMIVRSNKNPPTRVCPIFPELLPHLMRAREMAPDGAELVVTRYTPDAGILETFKKIVKRAGLTNWPKPMQNLRATRETELIAIYPIKDVSSWLGNSAPVAMKHYAMTMQSSFERAIEMGVPKVGANPPQNPPHSIADNGDEQHANENGDSQKAAKSRVFVAGDCQQQPLEMPGAGLEPA